MNAKTWQGMAKVGVVALTMGVMAGAAQAGGKCGGPSQLPCPTWTFGQGGTDLTNNTGFLTKETGTSSVGIPIATATAWSNTGGTVANGGSNTALQQAYIGAYGHMGVTDAKAGMAPVLGANNSATNADTSSPSELSSPNHAVDNSGNVDSILFTFTNGPVNLTSFTTGWEQTDADYSVLAYTGLGCVGGCSTTIGGLKYSELLTKGWVLIGNYLAPDVSGTNNGATHSFANTTLSSLWLIGALNQWVGGDSSKDANDYFKILSVTGCDCKTDSTLPGCNGTSVPEPGTLLLMGAGLFCLTRIRARRAVYSAA
jgi:hypothetical protein